MITYRRKYVNSFLIFQISLWKRELSCMISVTTETLPDFFLADAYHNETTETETESDASNETQSYSDGISEYEARSWKFVDFDSIGIYEDIFCNNYVRDSSNTDDSKENAGIDDSAAKEKAVLTLPK